MKSLILLSTLLVSTCNAASYITPDYYRAHPASQNITADGVVCSKSKYITPSNDYHNDTIISQCLGADVDAMIERDPKYYGVKIDE